MRKEIERDSEMKKGDRYNEMNKRRAEKTEIMKRKKKLRDKKDNEMRKEEEIRKRMKREKKKR